MSSKLRRSFISLTVGLCVVSPLGVGATPNNNDSRPLEYRQGTLPPSVGTGSVSIPSHYLERWGSDLSVINSNIDSFNKEIMELNDKITQMDIDIKSIKNKLKDTDTRLNALTLEISKSELEYQDSKYKLENFMRYEQIRQSEDRVPLLVSLFSGVSLSDVVSRYVGSKVMIEHGNELAKTLKSKELALKDKKQELVLLKDKQLKSQNNYVSLLKELKRDKNTVLNKLKKAKESKASKEKDIKKEQSRLIKEAEELISSGKMVEGFDIGNFAPSLIGYDDDKAKAVLSEVMTHIGVPYVWGGTTTKGFDCSGLMQYSYAKVGVKLPRVARQQQDIGVKISPYEVQAGDLVFYKDPAVHVIMYIGGGMYIHAPKPGDVVRVEKYNPSQWTSAVRVIGSDKLALSKEVF